MTDAGIDRQHAWRAIVARDARFDGRFVYAVSSTGVYCRPSCASRRPRPERVTFFASADRAEAAGFRACQRCHPRDEMSTADRRAERARALIDSRPEERFTLQALARAVRVSPFHLHRVFKRRFGVTPKGYADARRAERLRQRLKGGDTVSRASIEAGYGSASRAYEQSSTALGMTPGSYRRGGRGTRIRYAVAASDVGTVLVATTDVGLCSVALGDTTETLLAELRAEYPAAELERDDAGLGATVRDVLARITGTDADVALPLDVRATAFQWKVWRALQSIPSGDTRSYSAVAAAVGRPGAARAVARACASNPVSVVIPCHRVVREDGSLGGYRWGVERKRALLEAERAPHQR